MTMIKPFKITFSPKAKDQIREAKKWYNIQQQGLGKRLESDLLNALIILKRNPFVEATQYKEVRIAACKKFPYAIHYEIDIHERKVRIALFTHLHRKPFWLPELSDDDE
jgi:hypothetical protein